MNQSGRYLRRCHVCGATNEGDRQSLVRCAHCGKHLAPFYYFDEQQIIGFGDTIELPFRVGDLKRDYQPLLGIGLFWEDGGLPLLLKS
jgi:hypothetical protein